AEHADDDREEESAGDVGGRRIPLGELPPETIPAIASSEPTDRSMPAVMMVNVIPIAMMPMTDTCRRISAALSQVRNSCTRSEEREQREIDAVVPQYGQAEGDPVGAGGGVIRHGAHPRRARPEAPPSPGCESPRQRACLRA